MSIGFLGKAKTFKLQKGGRGGVMRCTQGDAKGIGMIVLPENNNLDNHLNLTRNPRKKHSILETS